MPDKIDPAATEQKAREILDNRIHAVRDLVAKRQHVNDLREQLDHAERADHAAYTAALRGGWTADELRALGLPGEDKKPRTKRTKTTSS